MDEIFGFVALVIAAAVGGAVCDHVLNKEELENKDKTIENLKAEKISMQNEFKKKIEEAAKKAQACKNYEHPEKFIIALFAVGISAANSDDEIADVEIQVIKDAATGLSQCCLPDHIVEQIRQLFLNIPNFNTAMKYVDRCPIKQWDYFENMIDLVISADEIINEKERAFKEAWIRYKNYKMNYSADQNKLFANL